MLKRLPRCLLATVLIFTFLLVSLLAISCAYHHGMDAHDSSQQEDSEGTLVCPFLSKIDDQSVIVSAFFELLPLELQSDSPLKSNDTDSILLEMSGVARSPPLILL
jgi:hypothetical protein